MLSHRDGQAEIVREGLTALSKAALLIDWENLTGRLSQSPWWVSDPAPLIPKIVAAVKDRTESLSPTVPLAYKGYFLQSKREVSEAAHEELMRYGFIPTYSTAAKNGADTCLIFKAARLLGDDYSRFYILTGDEDFADLAIQLELHDKAQIQAFIWPVDESQLRAPIHDWERKEYVHMAIALEQGTPPSSDELLQFVLCVQRLIDDGQHLGDWHATQQMLSKDFGLWDVPRCELLWQRMEDEGYLLEYPRTIQGKARRRRRLKYENGDVGRLLGLADTLLDQVSYSQGTCDVGKLVGLIPSDLREKYATLPDMLVASHHLTKSGASVSFESQMPSIGVLRPIRCIALSTWHQSLVHPDWDSIGRTALARRWVRHTTRGARNLPQEQQDRAMKEGFAVLKRAEASGALLPTGGGGQRPGLVVDSDHPLVDDTIGRGRRIFDQLPADMSTIPQADLFAGLEADGEPAFTASERRFWLAALASEQIVSKFEGKVMRNRNSPLSREAR